MQPQQRGERGTVTAEFAIVLPFVMLVMAVIVAAAALSLQANLSADAAAVVARAIARGEPESQAFGVGAEMAEHAVFTASTMGELICVRVDTRLDTPVLGWVPLQSRACAHAAGR